MPRIGGTTHFWMNGLYETISVLVLFPIILLMGAGSTIANPHTLNFCTFLGGISYPFYITHFPFVYMQIAGAQKHPTAPLETHVFLGICVFFVCIAVAFACMKLYDKPVRKWLSSKLYSFTAK